MRDWINSVLLFIGAESLTDEEWEAINLTGMETMVYNQAGYDSISALLISRELVSDLQKRLLGLFTAKGFEGTPVSEAKSQIFIGANLCS